MDDITAIDWAVVSAWLASMMEGLTPVFELFEGPETAIGLSLVLLFLGACFFLLLLARFVPVWLRLRRLTQLVAGHNSSYAEFKSAYPNIDEAFRKHRFLRHAWIEYSETLVFHKEGLGAPVQNTVRPQFYINIEATETSGTSFRMFHFLPNYFVGAGLLLTFVGLVAALYFAGQGVASANVEKAQESLGNLLNAATFKFMTSIAGLGVSLFLSISHRSVVRFLQHHFDKLCEAIEKGVLFATREAIAFEQLQELREHTVQLKRFNTDFAIEVGKVLEERLRDSMSESLGEALKPLTSVIDRMVGNVGEMNREGLASMAKTFGDDLMEAAGMEINALVSTLGEIQSSLRSVIDNLDQTSSSFGIRMAESASRIEEFLNTAGEQLKDQASSAGATFAKEMGDASNNLSASLAPLADQISRFEATVDSLNAKIESQRDAFVDVAGSVREITSDVASTINELRHASSPLAEVSNQFAAAAREVGTASKAISESQQGLRALSDMISKSVSSMETAWQNYQNRFEDVDKSLAGAIQQLVTGADAYRDHVQTFVSGLDRELDKAVRSLSGGIEALRETIEDLIDQKDDSQPVVNTEGM